MPLSITVSERILLKNRSPLYSVPPFEVKPSDLHDNPWCPETRTMGITDTKIFDDKFSRSDTVHACGGRTDKQTNGIAMAYTCYRYSIYAVAYKNSYKIITTTSQTTQSTLLANL